MIEMGAFEQLVQLRKLNVENVAVFKNDVLVGRKDWIPPKATHKYSISKTFTALAVGFAAEEGLLSLSDNITDYFKRELTEGTPAEACPMTIEAMLMMASGHLKADVEAIENEVLNHSEMLAPGFERRLFFELPVVYKPGTHFCYESGCSYILSAIVETAAKMPLTEYLTPRLFKPLGIPVPYWEKSPSNITWGGFGIHIDIDAMAKLGLFLLHEGNWHGRQLISRTYMQRASKRLIDTNVGRLDNQCGYGYQLWRCAWDGAYRAAGMYANFVLVLPKENAVICIASHEEKDTQAVMTAAWETIAPQLV